MINKKIFIIMATLLFLTITSLFSVEFIVTPTQDSISAEIENPKLPLELPVVKLWLKAIYSDGEYSFSARCLERITLGGSLKINSPIRLNQLVGYAACGGTEEFGNIYPYSNQINRSQFDLMGASVMTNWTNILANIEKGTFENIVLNSYSNQVSGNSEKDGEESHFYYSHTIFPEKEEKENEKDKTKNNNKFRSNDVRSDSCKSSVVKVGDITANRVTLVFINMCSHDTVVIGSIKAKNVDIINYGCNITIDRIDAQNKVRIFNFYGNIIIGDLQTMNKIPAKLTVDLKYDGTHFGIQSQENSEVIINNEEQNRIYYKWGDEEFLLMNETGVQKPYTDDNAFDIMTPKYEEFTLKLDISEDWYAFPAGEYKSTLYFTLEPLD